MSVLPCLELKPKLAKFWIERGVIAVLLRENRVDEMLSLQRDVLRDAAR